MRRLISASFCWRSSLDHRAPSVALSDVPAELVCPVLSAIGWVELLSTLASSDSRLAPKGQQSLSLESPAVQFAWLRTSQGVAHYCRGNRIKAFPGRECAALQLSIPRWTVSSTGSCFAAYTASLSILVNLHMERHKDFTQLKEPAPVCYSQAFTSQSFHSRILLLIQSDTVDQCIKTNFLHIHNQTKVVQQFTLPVTDKHPTAVLVDF